VVLLQLRPGYKDAWAWPAHRPTERLQPAHAKGIFHSKHTRKMMATTMAGQGTLLTLNMHDIRAFGGSEPLEQTLQQIGSLDNK
jgi:hypothetical protein